MIVFLINADKINDNLIDGNKVKMYYNNNNNCEHTFHFLTNTSSTKMKKTTPSNDYMGIHLMKLCSPYNLLFAVFGCHPVYRCTTTFASIVDASKNPVILKNLQ